jgi:hypothetical protein
MLFMLKTLLFNFLRLGQDDDDYISIGKWDIYAAVAASCCLFSQLNLIENDVSLFVFNFLQIFASISDNQFWLAQRWYFVSNRKRNSDHQPPIGAKGHLQWFR